MFKELPHKAMNLHSLNISHSNIQFLSYSLPAKAQVYAHNSFILYNHLILFTIFLFDLFLFLINYSNINFILKFCLMIIQDFISTLSMIIIIIINDPKSFPHYLHICNVILIHLF
jgi:hypothetical protein